MGCLRGIFWVNQAPKSEVNQAPKSEVKLVQSRKLYTARKDKTLLAFVRSGWLV